MWFEWVENIPYFPTVLAFCAATFAFVVDPSLAIDKAYLVIAMVVIFWGLTVANFFGMKWSARLNDPGVVFGTLVPAAVLIVLGVYWLSAGRHNQIPFHAGKLAPNLGSIKAIGVGGWATKVMGVLVGLGTLALISTWMLGPAKGLYATEQAGDLIPQLEYVNKAPRTGRDPRFPAIRLRYSEPNTDRPYRVPAGTVGIWIVGGMGLLGCVFGFVMGFVPPTGVKHWATPVYIGAMVLGIVISTPPVHHREGQETELGHDPSRQGGRRCRGLVTRCARTRARRARARPRR